MVAACVGLYWLAWRVEPHYSSRDGRRFLTTGQFIDRDKLHYIDVKGEQFSVKGPSITPRPPQGQPIVTALGHGTPAYTFA